MNHRIILASESPRRKELLSEMGVTFEVISPDVDESLEDDELVHPAQAACKLAQRKAHAISERLISEGFPQHESYEKLRVDSNCATESGCAVIVAADTMVVLDAKVYGKPADSAQACEFLRELSGRTHEVITGVCVWMLAWDQGEDLNVGFRSFAETSLVKFNNLTQDDINAYVETGAPLDKAGGYGAQDDSFNIIERIDGSLNNVIGLPTERLASQYAEFLGIQR